MFPKTQLSIDTTLSWKVGGMDCASCAAKIRGAVERLPGVSDVKLSVMSETLMIRSMRAARSRAAIEKQVSGLGYSVQAVTQKTRPKPKSRRIRADAVTIMARHTSITSMAARWADTPTSMIMTMITAHRRRRRPLPA